MGVRLLQRDDNVFIEIERYYLNSVVPYMKHRQFKVKVGSSIFNLIGNFNVKSMSVGNDRELVIIKSKHNPNVSLVNITLPVNNPDLVNILKINQLGKITTLNLVSHNNSFTYELVSKANYTQSPLECNKYKVEYVEFSNLSSTRWDHVLSLPELLEKNPGAYVDLSTLYSKPDLILSDGTILRSTLFGWEYHADVALNSHTMQSLTALETKSAMELIRSVSSMLDFDY